MGNPDLVKASIDLGKFIIQNRTQTIVDKKLAKAKGNKGETIQSLEEIINTLITEKNN